MQTFPTTLDVNNKNNFPEIHYNILLCLLRKKIYHHIIKEDENTYFDLDTFNTRYVKDTKIISEIIHVIISELNELGWKTKLSFGGTGLFIYSENLPKSCWDDSF
jgi:hypothetical protein